MWWCVALGNKGGVAEKHQGVNAVAELSRDDVKQLRDDVRLSSEASRRQAEERQGVKQLRNDVRLSIDEGIRFTLQASMSDEV